MSNAIVADHLLAAEATNNLNDDPSYAWQIISYGEHFMQPLHILLLGRNITEYINFMENMC